MYPRNFRGGKKGGNTPDCLKVCPFIPRTDNYFVGMKNDFPLRLLLRHMWHIRVQQTNKQVPDIIGSMRDVLMSIQIEFRNLKLINSFESVEDSFFKKLGP